MKRIFTVLAVTALMVAMLVAMAAPAFAGVQGGTEFVNGDHGNGGGVGDASIARSSGHARGQTGGIIQGNPHF